MSKRELPLGISRAKGKYRVRLVVDGYQHSLDAYDTLTDARAVLTIAMIGDRNLQDVTEEDVNGIVSAARGRGRTAARSAGMNVTRTLRALFNAAVGIEAGGLTESPVNVATPREPVRPHELGERTAAPAEVRALADAMPEHLRLAVYLGAWCALRQGEVLGPQRRDFTGLAKEGHARVYVQRQWLSKATPPGYADPKSGSKRNIHVPATVAAMVVEHLARYADEAPTSPLLPSSQDRRKPISQIGFDRYWRAARDLEKPGMRFHDLSHTGLTTYAQEGATLKDIMTRGG